MHSSIVPLCTCNQLNSHRTSANTSAQAQVDQTKLQLSLEQAQQDVVYMGGGGGGHLSIVSLCSQLANHRTSANTSAQAQVDQTKLQLSLEQAQQDLVCIVHGRGGGYTQVLCHYVHVIS